MAETQAAGRRKELIGHVRLSPVDERLIEDTARRLAEIRASEQARNAVQDALKR